MKKIKSISIEDYKPLSYAIVNNHYYFKINIEYEDKENDIINKRYSEIENLYKEIILKYPGCRIPKFPIKSFLMNIHIKEEEKKDIINKIQNFLNHLIEHKLLKEKNIVKDFFIKIKENENKINDFDEKEISNYNVNENLNKIENKEIIENEKEKIDNEFETLEFKPTSEYSEILENNLFNMFLEEEFEKSKGIIDKTKDVIITLISNYSQEIQNNNESNNNKLIESNLTEENSKILEYSIGMKNILLDECGKHIKKINEGLSYLIKNFINMKNYEEIKIKSLSNIKKICEENMKEKENLEENRNEKLNKKIFINEINKLGQFIEINQEFNNMELSEFIIKLKKNKTIVEELIEIYDRKQNHINFFLKLNSKMNDIKKKEEIEENVKTKKILKNEVELIQKYIQKERDFINKLNEDLEYEVDYFKDNIEKNIYNSMNELYKNNTIKQKQIFDKFNEIVSAESDSENSSKVSSDVKNSSSDENNNKSRKNSQSSHDDF
jgi:hypothetical protein